MSGVETRSLVPAGSLAAALVAFADRVPALRLNRSFPEPAALSGGLRALADVPGARLDASSGWPTGASWARVRQEHAAAAAQAAALRPGLDPRLPEARREAVRARVASLEALASRQLPPERDQRVMLRTRDGDRACFQVIVDRTDPVTGSLARYTIVLWGEAGRHLSDGQLALQLAPELTEQLTLLAAQDAAVAFAALRRAGLGVEEVVRGVVGPGAATVDGQFVGPASLASLALSEPLLSACLERATRDVSGATVDDPLALSVALPDRAPDFGVTRQRKWACAEADAPALRAWLASLNVRNLVYTQPSRA